MINHLILHGHFYQPPREDPWTGLVNSQPSATPFHDWNHRITKECYAANTASRFLRPDGMIEDIVNNYRVISFNIGPTLMWWLYQHAPHVYEAIVEADQQSVQEKGGHGNAIAQAYNHTILPLDNPRDARLQIQWGLADFEHHFGRRSEGIWLPETAVNTAIIDILIEEGVKFVILSPWQADAVYTEGMKKWKSLGSEPAHSWRPYRIERPGGSLNIVFYNHELAQGISFDHYLQSADALYGRLLRFHNDEDPSHLVNVATDGEVYGHHEPYGDMCLAALQKKISEKEDFSFTNYGSYLEENPPVYQVQLREGEDKLGSSWSCHHGVSRWYKDCGCSTGGKDGWNQKWRTPLREGMKALSTELWEIYRSEAAKFSDTDPHTLLKDYISVLTESEDPSDFAMSHLKKDLRTKTGTESLLTLLEGQKYRLFTFTSCGWFFADIDGIEATQNIRYALKAIQLYRPFSHKDLFALTADYLQEAISNKKAGLNGRDIMENQDSFCLGDGMEAASYFFIRHLIDQQNDSGETYGYYTLRRSKTIRKNDSQIICEIEIIDKSRQKGFRFRFKALLEDDGGISIRVVDLQNLHEEESIEDLAKLPLELRHSLMQYLMQTTEETLAEHTVHAFDQVRTAMNQSRQLGVEAPRLFERSAELVVTTLLHRELGGDGGGPDEERIEQIEKILQFASRYAVTIDRVQITLSLNLFIRELFDRFSSSEIEKTSTFIIRFINALRECGIEPDLTIPQKRVFTLLRKWRIRLHDDSNKKGYKLISKRKAASLSDRDKQVLSRIIALCDVMGIYADDVRPASVRE